MPPSRVIANSVGIGTKACTTIQFRTAMSANTAHEHANRVAVKKARRRVLFHAVQQAGTIAAHASTAVDRVSAANPPTTPAYATRRPVGCRQERISSSVHAARRGMNRDSVDGDATSVANFTYATSAPLAKAAGQTSSPPISTAISTTIQTTKATSTRCTNTRPNMPSPNSVCVAARKYG